GDGPGAHDAAVVGEPVSAGGGVGKGQTAVPGVHVQAANVCNVVEVEGLVVAFAESSLHCRDGIVCGGDSPVSFDGPVDVLERVLVSGAVEVLVADSHLS